MLPQGVRRQAAVALAVMRGEMAEARHAMAQQDVGHAVARARGLKRRMDQRQALIAHVVAGALLEELREAVLQRANRHAAAACDRRAAGPNNCGATASAAGPADSRRSLPPVSASRRRSRGAGTAGTGSPAFRARRPGPAHRGPLPGRTPAHGGSAGPAGVATAVPAPAVPRAGSGCGNPGRC
ncbi:hypothetical protein G6F22_017542 [Rhizopus arrhizus]|nr:hypothetical protein G6F22_017542 [Rhizopus arrhizus]